MPGGELLVGKIKDSDTESVHILAAFLENSGNNEDVM